MTTYLQAYFPETSPETLLASGPVSVNTYMTYLDSTGGAMTVTLNDVGSTIGQIKKLLFVADNGDVTITSDSEIGDHNITLENVGDYATFMWNGSIWRNIELIN